VAMGKEGKAVGERGRKITHSWKIIQLRTSRKKKKKEEEKKISWHDSIPILFGYGGESFEKGVRTGKLMVGLTKGRNTRTRGD